MNGNAASALANLYKARVALSEARTLSEVKKIRDLAEAARTYAKAAHLGRESQNHAAEIALLAARKAGDILKQLGRNQGQRTDRLPATVAGGSEYAQALKDTGTPERTAQYWQKLATVPETTLHEYVSSVRHSEKAEVTAAGLIREHIHRLRASLKKTPITLPQGIFRVALADPPWDFNNPIAMGYGAASLHYPLMSTEEICSMPLPAFADNAVLFLWSPPAMLVEASKVINAWGFEYKTHFVWSKLRHNFGHYNSVRHELLLIATRGSCLPDSKDLINSVQTIERSEHSRKPDEFRKIIDTMYPTGPRVELFARGSLPKGWEGYGLEFEAAQEVA